MAAEALPARQEARSLRQVRLLSRRGAATSRLLEDTATGRRLVEHAFPVGPGSGSAAMVLEHARAALADTPGTAAATVRLGEDVLCVTRPFVVGTCLEDRLQQGPLKVPEALDVAQGVLRALAAAHQRGVRHGGLKPANVVLGPEGVVLVDFALAGAGDPSMAEGPESGWYLSPEQAGLLDHPVGEWSDLYSVGVLLHHMLAGRVPFEGDRLGEVLRRHLNLPVPSLRAHKIPVPTALDQVMERLLRKDPHDRYRSAAAAAADLEALAAALARGEGDPAIVVGAHDRRDSLAEPSFVAREEEMRHLMDALRDASARPRLVSMEGESGCGKSRMLAEFQHRAALDGAWVVRAQGQDRVAARPFAMLDGLVRAVESLGPRRRQALRGRLDGYLEALGEALPRLGDILGPVHAGSLGPEDFGDDRTQGALVAFLDALAAVGNPTVLVMDDAQWMDAATLRLLRQWWSRGPSAGVLVVVAYRSEETPGDHPLRVLAPEPLRLGPLGPDGVRALAESMAGPLPPEAVETVVRLSQGNPFLSTSALRGLQECGAITPVPTGWRVDPARLALAGAADQHAAFLLRRLAALPEATGQILAVAAVLGKEFDLEPLAELAGLDAAATLEALQDARRRHILWTTGPAGRHAFTHDRLREGVLSSLEPTKRHSLHHRAAEHLSRRHADQVFDLAYHYEAAGEPDRALPFALEGAEQARRRYALDTAERYYRICLASSNGVPDTLGYRIRRGLGETLMLAGRYAEAAAELTVARGLAATDMERAETTGAIGELAFKQGDVEAAAASLEEALQALGEPTPRSTAGAALRLPWEAARQALHTLLPRRHARRRTALQLRRDRLVARLYSRLAYVNWFLRGAVCCLWAHLREMNLAETMGPGEESAQAYAEHGVALTQMPWFSRAFRYAKRSYEIRKGLDHLWGQGHALHFQGIVEYAAGRLGPAVESLREAQWILERTGDRWEANNSGVIQANAQYRLGDLEGAAKTAQRMHQEALRVGDVAAEGLSLEVWSKSTGGDVPAALIDAALARCLERDVQTREAILQADGVRLLAAGDPAGAAARFQEAQRIVDQAGLHQEFVAPIPLWTATALRERLLGLPPWDTRGRRRLLRAATRAAARGHRLARSYPNNRAHAWREKAWLAALGGRHRRARRLLDQSAAAAAELGMRDEAQRTRRDRGRIGTALGWSGSEAGVAAVRPPHAKPAAVPTLGLVERFGSLLEAGRRLAAALDPGEVQARLQEAGRVLLRTEEVHVLAVEDGAVAPPEAELAGLASQCLATGDVEVMETPDLRSALAVAVQERGQPRLVLCAFHRTVPGLFQDEERRLARFVAALGGAALENARGFAELQEAHARLRYQASLMESQAEAMTDGLLVVNREGRMTTYNRAFLRMWGLPRDIVEARQDAEAIAHVLDQVQDPAAFQEAITHYYQHPEASGEDAIALRDGRVLRRHTAPVRGDDGAIHGRIWHFRDVTKEERATQELRTAYERLKELDHMKSRFVNTAAHELNTPLTPMKLQLHLLQEAHDAGLDPVQQRAVDSLGRNLDRLERLVADIMDAARLESGRLRIENGSIDISAILRESAEGFQGQAERHGIRLETRIPEAIHMAADGQRLAQVVDNLVSNALRFTPGGGLVTLRATVALDGLRVQVEDTGPGLTDEQRSRLFAPFSQPVDPPIDRSPGTGLGLYICKGIVEQHGGRLWCEPTTKGACFVFCIPIRKAPGRRKGRPRGRRQTSRPASFNG